MFRLTERRAAPRAARTICLVFGIFALSGLLAAAHAATVPRSLPLNWSLEAGAQSQESSTDSVPGSNTIVDLINAGNGVWAATGLGASKYSPSTQEWVTYGADDGLGADEVPALHIVPGTDKIWVATSHSGVVELQPVPYGDGLFLSTDGGLTWQDRSPEVTAGTSTLKPASGPFQICYDITTFRGRVVAACFAGGLVISDDDGLTWQNIFASAADSADYANRTYQLLNNRYFSVTVDTTNADSLALYAGSAAGINKYVYLDSSLKVDGFAYRALAEDDGTIYAGTDIGVSKTTDHSLTWRTSLARKGIPTDHIGAVAAHGDTIWVGADEVHGESGAGLAWSFNGGKNWSVPAVQPDQTLGTGRRATSIVSAAGAWWVACEDGGLIRSADRGATWDVIFPDRVNALLALTDGDTTTLWAGIDSGLVRYTVPHGEPPVEASRTSIGPVTAQGLGQRVINLGLQESVDYGLILWTTNTAAPGFDEQTDGYAVSDDMGETWLVAGVLFSSTDIAFTGNYFWLMTGDGLYSGLYPYVDLDSLTKVSSVQTLVDNGRIKTPFYSLQTEIDNSGDVPELVSIWVGSDSGLAFFPNSSGVWDVVLPNTNPLQPDTVVRTYYLGPDTTNGGYETISGNFITALERQVTTGHDYIWAATQTTGTGQANGIARSINGETDWTVPITGHFVWNFAFNENEVWVASSEGLLHSPDNGNTWDTLSSFIDPESGATIAEGTEVFAVEVVGDDIWLGTDNGFVVLDKINPETVKKVRRHFEPVAASAPGGEGGAYATPVPFSENFNPNGVRFHFIPPVDGAITLSIWDFANNLVREFNVPGLSAGVQYDEAVNWDGRNGKGDRVAIGTYFFTIEYANGDVHWGTLAVIH